MVSIYSIGSTTTITTGDTSTATPALSEGWYYLAADGATAAIAIGSDPTATTTNCMLIPAGVPVAIHLNEGQQVAVIATSGTGILALTLLPGWRLAGA